MTGKHWLIVVVPVIALSAAWAGFSAGYLGALQFRLYANYGEIQGYVSKIQTGSRVDLPSSLHGLTVSVDSRSAVIGNPDKPDRLLIFDPNHDTLKRSLANYKGKTNSTALVGGWWFVTVEE